MLQHFLSFFYPEIFFLYPEMSTTGKLNLDTASWWKIDRIWFQRYNFLELHRSRLLENRASCKAPAQWKNIDSRPLITSATSILESGKRAQIGRWRRERMGRIRIQIPGRAHVIVPHPSQNKYPHRLQHLYVSTPFSNIRSFFTVSTFAWFLC